MIEMSVVPIRIKTRRRKTKVKNIFFITKDLIQPRPKGALMKRKCAFKRAVTILNGKTSKVPGHRDADP